MILYLIFFKFFNLQNKNVLEINPNKENRLLTFVNTSTGNLFKNFKLAFSCLYLIGCGFHLKKLMFRVRLYVI